MDKDKKVFEIDTAIGKLVIRENWDHDYPGVSVYFRRPDGAEINISVTLADILGLKVIKEEELLNEED